MIQGQAATDALKGVRDQGPAAVGNQVAGEARALTRRREPGPGPPARLGGGHGAGPPGAGRALEEDAAPPALPLPGQSQQAAVHQPIRVRPRRFERLRVRGRGPGVPGVRARHIGRDLAREGPEALDRPPGESRGAAQTPAPTPPGRGMALVPRRHLPHHRQPYLARRGRRGGALGGAAGGMVACKARHPQGQRGAGDVQKLPDTALPPAWGVEGADLLARLGACGRAVGGKAGAHGRRRWREALPEAACRLAGEPRPGGMKNDPRQCAGANAGVEPLEPLECLSHALGHPELPRGGGDIQALRPQPEPALLGKATLEAPHRCRMRPGLLGPRGGGARWIEAHRADECLPLLGGIEEGQLGWGRIGRAQPWASRPAASPGHTRPP